MPQETSLKETSSHGISLLDSPPSPKDFIELRRLCGWGTLDLETARQTLKAGLSNVTLIKDGQTIGFGRVIGDGVLYFYVQDLIVKAEYRGQNLGKLMLETLMQKIEEIAAPGASLGLMSAVDMEPFYEKMGFTRRPTTDFGAGMIKILNPVGTSV